MIGDNYPGFIYRFLFIYMATRKATSQKKINKKTKKARKTKPQKVIARVMPMWIRALIASLICVVICSIFYFWFIKPYSYRWKPCYGLKIYDVCVPCCYDVHGIDISHYQGNINWHELTETRNTSFPIEFVFMKATEGGDHADSTYQRNFEAAANHGFIRGVYHFFSPKTDPIKQADFFINTVNLSPGDLPPVLDVEIIGKASRKELESNVKIWLDRVEKHYGVKPILYTSYKFKTKYLSDRYFDDYPYWIAHYYVDSVKYQGKWHFWQHTDIGIVPGIENDVDLNVFNGTIEELKALTIK